MENHNLSSSEDSLKWTWVEEAAEDAGVREEQPPALISFSRIRFSRPVQMPRQKDVCLLFVDDGFLVLFN